MKKGSIFATFVTIMMMFSVCAVAGEVQVTEPGMVYTLGQEDVAVVELEANPSTGYSWQLDVPEGMKVVHRSFEPDDSSMLGSPGVEKVYIVSEDAGTYKLNCNLRHVSNLQAGQAEDSVGFEFISTGKNISIDVPKKYNVSESARKQRSVKNNLLKSDMSMPESYDLRVGAPLPIPRQQGTCGSCWAFATAGMFEIAVALKDNMTVDFSEQFLLDCNDYGFGCNGGNFYAHDFHTNYVVYGDTAAGAVSEHDDPYMQTEGWCNTPYTKQAKLNDWGFVKSSDANYPDWPLVSDIKKAMMEHGPIGVSVAVDYNFQNYVGGHFEKDTCDTVNHGVILVGWQDVPDSITGGYWILRNSWGPYWGQGGYMYIGYDVDMVGFNANYVMYKEASPEPSPEPSPGGGGESGGSGCFIGILF